MSGQVRGKRVHLYRGNRAVCGGMEMVRVREFFENCVYARCARPGTISLHVHAEFSAETFAVINIARATIRMYRCASF